MSNWSLESEDIDDLKSIVLGFFLWRPWILQRRYLSIECLDYNETNASRNKVAIEFHNGCHNRDS
jgi:hypothetical protein